MEEEKKIRQNNRRLGKRTELTLVLLFICLAFFISGFLFGSSNLLHGEIPIYYKEPHIKGNYTELPELPSPADRITAADIRQANNYIKIVNLDRYDNFWIAQYSDTGSMDNILDVEANGIYVSDSIDSIQIGDIISFNRYGDSISHRVLDIKFDDEGKYFLTKGDNSIKTVEIVRPKDINGVLIGVLY